MDKISSILPTNKRVKTVDVDESHPARPGTPSNGRAMGTTSSEREKIRAQVAEKIKLQEAANQDNIMISEQGKQAAGAEPSATKNYVEKETPHHSTPALKAYMDEMSAEPNFEAMVQAGSMKEQMTNANSLKEAPPKPAAPSFFIDNQPPPTQASQISSAHSLDKYA